MRTRQGVHVVAAVVLPGRVEGRMRVIHVYAQQPRLVGRARLADEVDRGFRAPGGLVQLGRGVVLRRRGLHEGAGQVAPVKVVQQDRIGIDALRVDPGGVVVLIERPVVAGSVAVLEVAVAVVDARLAPVEGAGQVELADQAAVVSGLGQLPRYQVGGNLAVRPGVAVARVVHPAGIHTGQKAGAAGRADGALTEGVSKGRARGHEAVEVGRADVRIAERADRIEALLVGAVPQNVGPLVCHGGPVWLAAGQANRTARQKPRPPRPQVLPKQRFAERLRATLRLVSLVLNLPSAAVCEVSFSSKAFRLPNGIHESAFPTLGSLRCFVD